MWKRWNFYEPEDTRFNTPYNAGEIPDIELDYQKLKRIKKLERIL